MIAIAQKKGHVYWNVTLITIALIGIAGLMLSDFILKGIIISILVFFILIFLYGIIGLIFSYKHIEIKGHRVSIKSGFQKKGIDFSKKDILYWIEKSNSYRGKEWRTLYLYTNFAKIKIISEHYKNYDRIKTALTNGVKHNIELEKKEKQKYYYRVGFIFIAMSIVLAMQASQNLFQIHPTITKNDLVFFSDSLLKPPQYFKQRRSQDKIIFEITQTNESLSLIANSLEDDKKREILNLKKGSALIFGVSQYDYASKITKSTPLGFWEQHFDIPKIKILTLQNTEKEYLSVENTNKSIIRKNSTFWIWSLMSFLVSCYFLFKAIRKNRESI